MNWLIIGSTAAYHWFPDSRKPSDIDLLTPAKISGNHSKICVVDAQYHEAAELVMERSFDKVFASPDMLLTLKVSHANWNIKWEKTMHDIAFLKKKGALVDLEVWRALTGVWKKVHGPKHVNMSKSMNIFFEDSVKREHDHDYLHEVVAFNKKPMHELLRPDHGTAWCSEARFFELEHEQMLETCLEEIMVTAIERSALKFGCSRVQQRKAMHKAHFQLCTSMTTGYFARTLILNRNELLFERLEKWHPKLQSALKTMKAYEIKKK